MADEIRAECGGQVRLVWCQEAGEGTDPGAQGTNLRLMGFDTHDGRGERIILTNLSNYAKPLLTPDGQKVIFSNRPEREIYVVGFAGAGLKPVAAGLALAVWRDPLTETEWVYAGTEINRADSVIANVRRFRLDNPEVSENVWSKTPLNIDNFQLSADGRSASGVFPWPACGIAALPDREWKKFGDGCWPALCPDNSLLFWIFDGAHRNLTMFNSKNDERWVININSTPGLDGYEVYHPRWSSHPLFMVMTGPYKLGEGNNRIRGGGRDVEIYLGRFAKDFKKIERWVRVTHNSYADFFPDMWVAAAKKTAEPSEGLGRDKEALARSAENGLPDREKAARAAWPISYAGLVFFWQNRSKANAFTDPVTQLSHGCQAQAKGRARYGRYFEMRPAGGAFIAEGGKGELLDACAASRQLGLEVWITSLERYLGKAGRGGSAEPSEDRMPRRGIPTLTHRNFPPEADPPSVDKTVGTALRAVRFWKVGCLGEASLPCCPIAGYAADRGSWNFLLGQQDRRLVFQLRSAKGGPDYIFNICDLPLNQPNHVIISCSSSAVVCYLNGEQVFSREGVYGGNWSNGKIIFGNEPRPEYTLEADEGKTGWQGLIENIAIYARWIGPEEARKKFKAGGAQLAGKRPAAGMQVKARLVASPAIPLPAAIAPYRRALAVSHYRVEKVLEGNCASREILAAQWVILDGQALKPVRAKEIIKLELFSDHPELEGERLIMDSDRYDLPMYYEAGD